MNEIIKLLLDNPLLLLFVVAAIGYPLGRIKIGGSSLGVASVLFVGLAIGALDPNLKLPDIIYNLGLVLFVYTIGLSSGPGFFASFRRKGLRYNLLVLGMIGVGFGLTLLAGQLLNLKATFTTGLFAGSLTNTPSLAGAIEFIKGSAPKSAVEQMVSEPVVGYSIAYPIGVIGMILAIYFMQRIWKIDYRAEAKKLREVGTSAEPLKNLTLTVTRPEATKAPISAMIQQHGWNVIFGRLKRGEDLSVVTADTWLQKGDLVGLIGTEDELAKVKTALGEESPEHIELDRTQLDFRRIFVSNPKVVGHRLRDLHLTRQFGALVTRVRRGDVEFLPHGDTVLEPGDRVRVVTQRENMDAVAKFFGDSYRALSEIDILSFGLGLALGLLLGLVPIPLPGVTIKLGFAGGPLVVALILGARERTGPIVWSLPYSANLTLRQVGLVLFLAGVGTRAGYPFFNTITQGNGLAIFAAGAVITCTVALLTLWIGYKLFKVPMGFLIGMLAGLQTQPAVLGFALEQSDNELPNLGYATVYPVATISKIIGAQLLLTLLL